MFCRFWEKKSQVWAESLAEGGHEIICEEVGELDSHKNTSDL
jgi:hypothetical protein